MIEVYDVTIKMAFEIAASSYEVAKKRAQQVSDNLNLTQVDQPNWLLSEIEVDSPEIWSGDNNLSWMNENA